MSSYGQATLGHGGGVLVCDPPPHPPADPPETAPSPPPQVLTDSWGGGGAVTSGSVIVTPPPCTGCCSVASVFFLQSDSGGHRPIGDLWPSNGAPSISGYVLLRGGWGVSGGRGSAGAFIALALGGRAFPRHAARVQRRRCAQCPRSAKSSPGQRPVRPGCGARTVPRREAGAVLCQSNVPPPALACLHLQTPSPNTIPKGPISTGPSALFAHSHSSFDAVERGKAPAVTARSFRWSSRCFKTGCRVPFWTQPMPRLSRALLYYTIRCVVWRLWFHPPAAACRACG